MTEAFKFQNDTVASIETMLKAAIEVLFKTKGDYTALRLRTTPPYGELTTKLHDWDGVFIAELIDYKSERERDGDVYCLTKQELLEKAMERIKAFDRKNVNKLLGDGYDEFFNHFDGSTGVAYRLQWQPSCGWNRLLISATHAYYGK